MRMHTFAIWLITLLAAVLLAAGCGSDDDDSQDAEPKRDVPATTTDTTESDESDDADPDAAMHNFTIVVKDGVVQGGPKSLRVDQGEHVMIVIQSDAADEVHLHGIDLEAEVGPGKGGMIQFEAKDQGSYELEMHESGTVVGAVVVS